MPVTISPPVPVSPPIPRLMRVPELAKIFGVKKNTIYVWYRRGHFPKPIRLAGRSLAWRADDISAWLKARQETATNPK